MSRKLLGALALFLAAAAAQALDKPAFYDPASTYSQGNSKAVTGAGLSIDTRGVIASVYVRGTDATADGTYVIQCAATNSASDDDWGTCSGTYTLSGVSMIPLSAADANWQRVKIVTLNTGAATGTWTLDQK